jgi:predicted porin
MQKKLIALAVAGLVSGAAFAQQSNVTIYGIADVGYAYTTAKDTGPDKSYKKQHNIDSGLLSPSRLGFKGVEDLGNGVSALFVLEYKLMAPDTANGIGGARQQLVGLTGGFGTVVAGYAQTAGFDFACATSAYAGGALDVYENVGGATLLSCSESGRAGNAFAYISPAFAGVTIAYNHSRVTEINNTIDVDNDPSDAYANLLAVKYANGPIAAQFVYAKINTLNSLDESSTEWGINGSYDAGVAKVYASYQVSDLKDPLPANPQVQDNKNNKWGVSASFPIGAGAVHVGYAKSSLKETRDDAKATALTVAYTHGLSKRTTAYAGYTTTTMKNIPNPLLPPPGIQEKSTSSAFGVGLRHSF